MKITKKMIKENNIKVIFASGEKEIKIDILGQFHIGNSDGYTYLETVNELIQGKTLIITPKK